MKIKRLAALVLSICLLTGFTACNFNLDFLGGGKKSESTSQGLESSSEEESSSKEETSEVEVNPAEKEIDVNLTAEDIQNMTPYSVSISLLLDKTDENTNDYGVTWYVADDKINVENEGGDFVQFVKKEGSTTVETVSFEGVKKNPAKRQKASGTIYLKAEVCNLEAGAEYFWRCGNSVKVFGEVSTLRVPKNDGAEFTFMHVSDTQNTEGVSPGNYYHKALQFASDISNVDFIVHTGDMVQEAKEDALWKEMLDYKVLRETPVMAVSGNHDYWASHSSNDGTNETYRHYNIKTPYQVTQTGMYYSFDYQDCHFIMLNVGDIDQGRWSKQLDWLEKDLAENTKKWTVLSIHEPFYSLGKYGQQTTAGHYHVDKIRADLTPIIEGKVDLVLQGHDHMVQYTYPLKGGVVQNSIATEVEKNGVSTKQYSLSGGTMYLMSGAAGNQNRNNEVMGDDAQKALYAYYLANDPNAATYKSAGAQFSNITVSGTDITVYTYGYLPEDESARLITSVSIVK